MKKKQSYEELGTLFLANLKTHDMSGITVSKYRRWLEELLCLCGEKELYLSSESKESVLSAIRESAETGYHTKKLCLVANRFIDFLEDKPFKIHYSKKTTHGLIAPEFLEAKGRYLQYCSDTLKNSEYTVRRKDGLLSEFLSLCTTDGLTEPGDLNHLNIHKEAKKCSDHGNSFPIIQAFLQFLCKEGILEKDYSFALEREKRQKKIPVIYTMDEIRRIEEVIPRDTLKGKRDRAMILLCSRLGLRSCDVVNLKFSNLNFKEKTISLIQIKTGKEICLPMVKEIEEALLEYIRVRPESQEKEKIFLRAHAPFQAVTTSALRFQLTHYMKLAEIDIEAKKHGPHTLRASLASSMINDGFQYSVVKQVLGHQGQKAISHYAHLDENRLRICSLKPKAPSGEFAFLLGGIQ